MSTHFKKISEWILKIFFYFAKKFIDRKSFVKLLEVLVTINDMMLRPEISSSAINV